MNHTLFDTSEFISLSTISLAVLLNPHLYWDISSWDAALKLLLLNQILTITTSSSYRTHRLYYICVLY